MNTAKISESACGRGRRLEGDVAIVTGAGSVGPGWGNGKAAAVLFAQEGARVLAVDRSHTAALETKALIDAEGGECEVVVADVSNALDVNRLVAACVDRFGRIDVLHNNVGIARAHGLLDTDEAEWDEIFAVNVKSMFLTCRAAMPYMERQYATEGRLGRIINVGGVTGRRWTGVPMTAYAATKAAIESLTRSVALEYALRGVRCNCVVPGLMDTPHIVQPLRHLYGDGNLDRLRHLRQTQSPTGRMGTAWDVAHAALFLASTESAYVNGHALVVDGGQSVQTWSPQFAQDAVAEISHAG